MPAGVEPAIWLTHNLESDTLPLHHRVVLLIFYMPVPAWGSGVGGDCGVGRLGGGGGGARCNRFIFIHRYIIIEYNSHRI